MSPPSQPPVDPAQQVANDQAAVGDLQAGHGKVLVSAQSYSEAAIQGGYKFTPNWAAYGDAWAQPDAGTFGGDAGITFKGFSAFAGAWQDTESKEVGGEIGFSVTF